VALIVPLVVCAALTPLLARLAMRLGVVDRPGALKVHERPVPYLGGVAVLVALAGPVAVGRPTLAVPLVLATALGLADDVAELPPGLRLVAEVGIGVTAAAVVDVRGPAGAALTVAVVVLLLNAVNLLDGLDGLASGVGLAGAAGFAVVLGGDARVLALALAGALAGFLLWNRPPARIYLGDAGSYLLGTALAVLLAEAWGAGRPVAVAAGSVLLVAVPVADTTVAVLRRARARRPLLQGDRGHVYDQLVDRGWRRTAATGACVLAQVALAAAAVGVAALPAEAAVPVAAAVVVVVALPVLHRFTSPQSWSR
jgi:UDP-GlcNAc:undecaprenyl-phosphate/decaprenyl-phosphate GlcNAc-1-phosphate transferase